MLTPIFCFTSFFKDFFQGVLFLRVCYLRRMCFLKDAVFLGCEGVLCFVFFFDDGAFFF